MGDSAVAERSEALVRQENVLPLAPQDVVKQVALIQEVHIKCRYVEFPFVNGSLQIFCACKTVAVEFQIEIPDIDRRPALFQIAPITFSPDAAAYSSTQFRSTDNGKPGRQAHIVH